MGYPSLAGWFIVEHHIKIHHIKIDDLGVPPYFRNFRKPLNGYPV